MVQTAGSSAHPHMVLLNTYFPSFVAQYTHLLPAHYPGLVAAFKMQDQIRNRNSGVFLRGMRQLQERRERQHRLRQGVAQITRQMARRKAKGLKPWTTLATLRSVKESEGSRTIATQMEDGPEFSEPKVTMNHAVQVPDIQPGTSPDNKSRGAGPQSNDDTDDDDHIRNDDEDLNPARPYNQSWRVNRRNSALPLAEAQAIITRKASQSMSMPPALPDNTPGIHPMDPQIMSSAGFADKIKRVDHQSWFEFQLFVTNKFVHAQENSQSSLKACPG